MREGGPIENATVVGYAAAVLAVWLGRNRAFGTASALSATLVLVGCVVKETGLRRPLLIAAGYDPNHFQLTAWPNLLAIALGIALVPAGAWLVWRHTRDLLGALKDARAPACTLVWAFVCTAISQAFDYVSKVDALPVTARAIFLSLEEVLELAMPLLVVLAVLQVRARSPRKV
jgi:hypothetical protein